jgi:hypothetical protein
MTSFFFFFSSLSFQSSFHLTKASENTMYYYAFQMLCSVFEK